MATIKFRQVRVTTYKRLIFLLYFCQPSSITPRKNFSTSLRIATPIFTLDGALNATQNTRRKSDARYFQYLLNDNCDYHSRGTSVQIALGHENFRMIRAT